MDKPSGLIVISGGLPRGLKLPAEPGVIGMQADIPPSFDQSNVVFLRRPPRLRLIPGGGCPGSSRIATELSGEGVFRQGAEICPKAS